MKKLIFLSVLLTSGAGLANPPATGGAAASANNDPNQMICMNVAETGSRLSHTRVCQTRAQWDLQRRSQRQEIERAQAAVNPRN